MIRRHFFLFLLPLFLYACEKPEEPLVLPPPTGASHAVLELGADYGRQVFFDFESGKAVLSSNPKSWHLAFESGLGQRHIFMNGGEKVYLYNTHKTDLKEVTILPDGLYSNGTGWTHDMPCGMSDSTAIGDWFRADGSSKAEVYIAQLTPDSITGVKALMKFRILALDGDAYRFEWAPLASTAAATQVSLPKDTAANFSYFSFFQGQSFPEPAKETWDIVFTRYRHIYRDYMGIPIFPYEVTGVLLNPGRTRAVPDSLSGFENITYELASTKTPSPYRDAIGFAWKTYTGAVYVVKRINSYMIWTQNGAVYKMHFLDYMNSSQQAGYPAMEYLRLR